MLMQVSELLKALADTNRLRILNLLHERRLCVCDLEAVLEINQSNLSRHLSKLKQAGIVSAQKKALFTYYSRKPLPAPYGPIVDDLCAAIHADPAWQPDRARLARRLRSSRNRCD